MKTNRILYIVALLFILICGLKAQEGCDLDHLRKLGIHDETMEIEIEPFVIQNPKGPYNPEINAEKRLVYFLHGLNGDRGSWDAAAAAVVEGAPGFPARKAETYQAEYKSSQSSFAAATNVVRQDIALPSISDPNYDPRFGIMIGHSQGGLVARNLDRFYSNPAHQSSRRYGGLVTVATSNQGAEVLNQVLDHNGIQQTFGWLAQELAKGPITEFQNNDNFFVRLLLTMVNVNQIANAIFGLINTEVVPTILGRELPEMVNEYRVGSEFLDVLNAYEPSILDGDTDHSTNIVSFYAIRDTLSIAPIVEVPNRLIGTATQGGVQVPVFSTTTLSNVPVPISWATLKYLIDSPNNVPTFTADQTEGELAGRMLLTQMDYIADVNRLDFSAQQNEAYAIGALASGWLSPLAIHYFLKAKRKRETAEAYRRGVNAISNFDQKYRTMIGAWYSEVVEEPFLEVECVCEGEMLVPYTAAAGPGGDCSHITNMYPGYDCEVNTFTVMIPRVRWFHKDSDGLVLAESAMDIPQATEEPIRIRRSTHMGIRNDANTAIMLEQIFDGEVGLFYKVDQLD